MDDWNQFHGNNDRFEEYRGQSSSFNNFEQVSKKKEKYVTKKFFAITLIFAMIFSSVLGAGGVILASEYLGGNGLLKNINATNYNITKATGSEMTIQEIKDFFDGRMVYRKQYFENNIDIKNAYLFARKVLDYYSNK